MGPRQDGRTRTAEDRKGAQSGWTRDYILGMVLMSADAIAEDGHVEIAAEMRHLVMNWYTKTGARRFDTPLRRRARMA